MVWQKITCTGRFGTLNVDFFFQVFTLKPYSRNVIRVRFDFFELIIHKFINTCRCSVLIIIMLSSTSCLRDNPHSSTGHYIAYLSCPVNSTQQALVGLWPINMINGPLMHLAHNRRKMVTLITSLFNWLVYNNIYNVYIYINTCIYMIHAYCIIINSNYYKF